MKYRQLGRTNLQVSVLGLGSGGANRLGQARQADPAVTRAFVRHALDLGINIIDTAPSYGSEAALGAALAGVPRDSYILCTKFSGTRDDPPPGALRASLEASLRALRTDYVDVLYFHGLNPQRYDWTIERFMGELRQCQQDGLTRFIGATEQYETDETHAALERALREDLFDVIMVGHNMISPSGLRAVLPLAQARNVGVVVMCAVRTITNADMLRETLRQWKEDGSLAADAVPDESPLDWILSASTPTIAEAAYKFAVEPAAVSTVLTGTANPAHLDANVAAILGAPLPAAISQRLADTFVPAEPERAAPPFPRSRPLS